MGTKSVVLLFLVALATSHAQMPGVPCCFPEKFEIGYASQIGVVHHGIPIGINIYAQSALDYTTKQQGESGVIFVNKKEPSLYKLIKDYNTGRQYTIDVSKQLCDSAPLKDPMEHCVPAGYDYNRTDYLGDKALYIDTFFYSDQKGLADVVVTQTDCIPHSTSYSGSQRKTATLAVTGFYNYVGDIADPRSFFDLPDFCTENMIENTESELMKVLKYRHFSF